MALEIRRERVADVPVVFISGEVDRLAGPALKKAVGAVLRENSPSCLLLDLSACTYLDAVALSVMLSARDELAPGHCLGIIGASSNLLHLFSVVGLDEGEQVHFLSSRRHAEKLITQTRASAT